MTLQPGTVYRCNVGVGEDPAPSKQADVFLRWSTIRGTSKRGWRDHLGRHCRLIVSNPKPVKPHLLPPEWKEILAEEIVERFLAWDREALEQLAPLFAKRRKR